MKYGLHILFLAISMFLNAADYYIRPEQWKCANLEQRINQDNMISGRTVFVKGKKTPFLFSSTSSLTAGKELHGSFEIKSSISGIGRVFYRLEGGKFSDKQRIEYKVESSSQWQRKTFVIESQNSATVQFRIDPIYADGTVIALRNFTVREVMPPKPCLGVTPSHAVYQKIPAIESRENAQKSITFPPRNAADVTTSRAYLNYPAECGKFTMNLKGTNQGTVSRHVKLTLNALDALNQRLPSEETEIVFPCGITKQTSTFTVPAECVSVTLTLTPADGDGELILNDLRFEPDWQPGELWLPWRGAWIWDKKKSIECTFKREFTLDALPAKAFLQLNADDAITRVTINDKDLPVKENAANCFAFDDYEISSLLLPGVNKLEIRAINHSGDRGMMAELAFYDRNGKISGRLVSDETFTVDNVAAVRHNNPWLIPVTVSHRFYGNKLPGSHPSPVFRSTGKGKGLPKCSIRYGKNRIPLLLVDDRTIPLNHYWGPAKRINPVQIANCAANGIHQYWLGVSFEWEKEGKYDFSPIDQACRKLLELDPEALILLELPVDSLANPSMEKWCRLNPEELVRDETGNSHIVIHGVRREVPSWSSDRWLNEAKRIMTAAVKHVAQQEYASQIIGFFPVAGLGHEWAFYGSHNKLYLDYSEVFQKQLQRFAPGARMPTRTEREAAKGLLDPKRDYNLISFRKFLSERTAYVIDEIGRAVKDAGKGRPLYGTYYGYTTYTAIEHWNENGHFALHRLLNSSNIDFLVSIVRYDNRGAGQESGAITPVASHWINGKACVIQSDLRTHRAAGRKDWVIRDLRDSIEVIKREIAWALVSGASFEFGYSGYGWMAGDPRLMQLFGHGQVLSKRLAETAENYCLPGIAVLADEDALAYIGQNSTLPRKHLREMLRQFAHAGTGYDVFLLSDFSKLEKKGYRCFFFPNSVWLSPSSQKMLTDKFPNGASAIIFPPSAVTAPKGINTILGNSEWDSLMIQKSARNAGILVHNSDSGDATMVSGNLLAIHTGRQGGERELIAPSTACMTATELFTGKKYTIKNGKFKLKVKPAETYLFQMVP